MSENEKPVRAEQSGSFKIDACPGVTIPDWSVVTSERVGDALEAIFETCNWNNRWAGLSEDEYRTRCAILKAYARTGHAPSIEDLGTETGYEPEKLQMLIAKLAARDMIVTGEDCCVIIGAYPFVDRDTEHHVHVGNTTVNAMCAIDSLGAGAMLDSDVTIKSSCRYCTSPIHILTKQRGTALKESEPDDIIVWAGVQYENNCAASSLCTTMAFFCSNNHFNSWFASQASKPSGYRLSLEEGFQLGKAIFMPLLAGDKEATVFP